VRRAGAGGVFSSPPPPLATLIGSLVSGSGPNTRPHPRAHGSSWSGCSLVGDQRAGGHHHLPWLLGRFRRWWPGCATPGAQRAPGSAHWLPLGTSERAGDGTGAVTDTPVQWGKAHHPGFHCTWSQVGCCPPRLIFRGIN